MVKFYKTKEKNIVIYKKKNTYVLELLLNVVTAGTETLTVLGNKLFYACGKEVCSLLAKKHFDTIHQLLIIETL
jgi:predicted hydrocarbon binding protein